MESYLQSAKKTSFERRKQFLNPLKCSLGVNKVQMQQSFVVPFMQSFDVI